MLPNLGLFEYLGQHTYPQVVGPLSICSFTFFSCHFLNSGRNIHLPKIKNIYFIFIEFPVVLVIPLAPLLGLLSMELVSWGCTLPVLKFSSLVAMKTKRSPKPHQFILWAPACFLSFHCTSQYSCCNHSTFSQVFVPNMHQNIVDILDLSLSSSKRCNIVISIFVCHAGNPSSTPDESCLKDRSDV